MGVTEIGPISGRFKHKLARQIRQILQGLEETRNLLLRYRITTLKKHITPVIIKATKLQE